MRAFETAAESNRAGIPCIGLGIPGQAIHVDVQAGCSGLRERILG